jgi:Xaa-Pro aminopeptidase
LKTPSSEVDLTLLRAERLARLRQKMRQADVAAVCLLDPVNMRYATDASNMQVWSLHNPTRYAFIATDGPVIQFEFENCGHLTQGIQSIDETRPAISWSYMMAGPEAERAALTFAAEIADLVRRHGGANRRLAVDRIDHVGFLALRREGVEVVDGNALIELTRVLKTPQELIALREAIAGCERAVGAMRAALRPGLTEQELWSVLHQHNIAQGGEWIKTRLLTSGPRTNPWYNECSDRVIEDGDLVAFDTDLVGKLGYCCDISRTWRAGDGQASDQQRRTYALAYDNLQRLMALVRPGATLGDIATKFGPIAEGYRGYSCLLHGVGMCDEYPTAFWRDQRGRYDAVIEPGMVLSIESYLGPEHAAEGVKLEEQVLVKESGIEVMSSLAFEDDWL